MENNTFVNDSPKLLNEIPFGFPGNVAIERAEVRVGEIGGIDNKFVDKLSGWSVLVSAGLSGISEIYVSQRDGAVPISYLDGGFKWVSIDPSQTATKTVQRIAFGGPTKDLDADKLNFSLAALIKVGGEVYGITANFNRKGTEPAINVQYGRFDVTKEYDAWEQPNK